MAEIVLGIGTSHTPLLSLVPELWTTYAARDSSNPELAYPPHGWVMSYTEALNYLPAAIRAKYQGAWDSPERVAPVASGGLSRFVLDEEMERGVLAATGGGWAFVQWR